MCYFMFFLLGCIVVLLGAIFYRLCSIFWVIKQDKIYVLPDPKDN